MPPGVRVQQPSMASSKCRPTPGGRRELGAATAAAPAPPAPADDEGPIADVRSADGVFAESGGEEEEVEAETDAELKAADEKK